METTVSNPAHAAGSQATVDRAAQGIHEAVERVAAKAAAMADRDADTAADSQSPQFAKFEELMNGEWAEAARNEVREHPLTVVGVALIAGLMIGRL